MYHKISIAKLSKSQISKLLNGHRVRVKHGHGHEIHVSHEQHKKIISAHHKGKAHTIQFDPFQMEMEHHKHLRHHASHLEGGRTYAERLAGRTRKTFAPVKKFFEHDVRDALRPLERPLKNVGYAVKDKLLDLGKQGLSHLEHELPSMIDSFKNQAISKLPAFAMENPELLAMAGVGIHRHRGRPKKHISAIGEGRRRGRPRKGKALNPAGYGEGAMIPLGYGHGHSRGRSGRR